MLDGAVLAGRIHRLEDQQHGPAVLGIELVLQGGQQLHPLGEHGRSRLLVTPVEVERVGWIHLIEAEIRSVADAEGGTEAAGPLQNRGLVERGAGVIVGHAIPPWAAVLRSRCQRRR